MTMSAAEAERQVESSRGELDRTVGALKDKMTPGELFREARRAMGGAGDQVVSKLIDQAKENPMPFAVMGVGLAWLASSSKARHPSDEGSSLREARSFAPAGPTLFEKASVGLQGAAGAVSDQAHAAGAAASHAKDKLADTAASAMNQARVAKEKVSSAAASTGQKAQDLGRRTKQAAGDLFDREPLLVGALGLIIGLALGAAAPATETEKKAIAPMRDKLADKTKALVQDRLEDVRDAAQAAYGSVKEELAKPADGQNLSERARNAASAGVQAARDQA